MLTEFAWSKAEEDTETGHYMGDETLDCQIGITTDGKFEIRSHIDSSQVQTFDTSKELGEALAQVLQERASR